VSGDIFCSVNELECSLIEFMQRINPIICNRRKEDIFQQQQQQQKRDSVICSISVAHR
jgi:hypothetical protein